MNNKKKLLFSTAEINWDDDASIEAFARKAWETMNKQIEQPTIQLTSRYIEAVAYANEHHAKQARKGKDVPYMAHLLAVSSLVLEAGGDEDQAIAGLLHDVAEDHGGAERLKEIKEKFGTRVEEIVRACSDSITDDPDNKEAWLTRKRKYLQQLKSEASDALVVSAADKLHNSRDTLADIKREGIQTLDRFNGGAEGTVAYYTALWMILGERGAPRLLTEQLGEVVQAMVDELYPAEDLNINESVVQQRVVSLFL